MGKDHFDDRAYKLKVETPGGGMYRVSLPEDPDRRTMLMVREWLDDVIRQTEPPRDCDCYCEEEEDHGEV